MTSRLPCGMALRDAREAVLEQRADLRARQVGVGRGVARGLGGAVELAHLGEHRPLADQRHRFVHRDAHRPGRERRVAAELAEVAVHVEPRLLEHVFGVGVAARDRARGAKQPLVVPADEHLEHTALAGEHAGDQRVIGEVAGGGGEDGGRAGHRE